MLSGEVPAQLAGLSSPSITFAPVERGYRVVEIVQCVECS